MALASPGIETREIDAGGGVASLGSSPGAAVLDGTWGPVNQRVLVTNEIELVNKFGEPNNNNARRWYTINNFLGYVGAAYVVRAVGDLAMNAEDTGSGVLVENANEFENVVTSSYKFIARYPGAKGNSITVHVCDSTAAFDEGSTGWAFAGLFDAAPGTSDHATKFGASADELHVVVVDTNGKISGTPDTILETHSFLSKASDGKNATGGNNYYVDVINQTSSYIYAGTTELSAAEVGESDYGDSVTDGLVFATDTSDASISTVLSGGVDDTPTPGNATTSLNLFASPEDVAISLIMTADGFEAPGDHEVSGFANAAITIAETRKDCMVTVSPMVLSSTGGVVADPLTVVTEFYATITRSSYVFATCNYKYQYDKYNDVSRYIPDNGDTAGLIAKLDRDFEPWFSPAGFNRGNIQNVTKLAWNPSQTQRDVLYKNFVNPVVSFPGSGTILYGDKTFVSKPGAFDRINIRRLFIVVRTNVASFSKSILFELNDSFTRGLFTSAVEQYLDTVQAARGLEEYQVTADESNNTPGVLNANQFVGDIFIRPLNSINFIRLNFIAVRAGVEFSEITG